MFYNPLRHHFSFFKSTLFKLRKISHILVSLILPRNGESALQISVIPALRNGESALQISVIPALRNGESALQISVIPALMIRIINWGSNIKSFCGNLKMSNFKNSHYSKVWCKCIHHLCLIENLKSAFCRTHF